MRDSRCSESFSAFLSRHEATLEILVGRAKGSRVPLDQPRVRIGRGPGVDLAFDAAEMAREHAVIEFDSGAFHVYGKDGRRPVRVNGQPTGSGARGLELKHGDRIEIGAQAFTFALGDREPL